MRAAVEAQRQAENEQLADQDKTAGGGGDGVTPKFVRQCLYNNERGDGLLYAAMLRDKYLFVKNTQTWLRWCGHHWDIDKQDTSHAAVEQIAVRYLEEGRKLQEAIEKADADGKKDEAERLRDERKAYNDRGKRLRSLRGAKNALEWSHKIDEPLSIIGDEIDQKPLLLPCRNGVIDLRTGRMTEGRPGDYLVKAIPVDFPECDGYLRTGEGSLCPSWDAFLATIHMDDPQLIGFIQRLFGYSITGLTIEHFIATFVGDGRNGKGTMFETLRDVMGELAWAIQPELILENKNVRSSAGPSPDIVSLQGRRVVIASETDENRRISAARVKQLTGGDTLCGRAPHDRYETNFKTTHTLFLQTNHIPRGLTKDFALLKRLIFIHYPLKFVDDPTGEFERQRDPDLPVKLKKELPGILAWLVRGCLLWQKEGLNPPAKLKADIEALRYSEDLLDQYLDQWAELTDPDHWITFAELYGSFKKWYEENVDDRTSKIPSKITFGRWLDKKALRRETQGGCAYVYGVKLLNGGLA